MLIVVSPAKTLDYDTAPTTSSYTQPQFLEHSQVLIDELKHLSVQDIAELMKLSGEDEASHQAEVLADLSGVLVGAILNGLGEQLDLNFSQGYPTVLGHHTKISSIIGANTNKWEETLTIEVNYTIENYDLVCDVLLLFTHDSIASINSRLAYFYDLDEF